MQFEGLGSVGSFAAPVIPVAGEGRGAFGACDACEEAVPTGRFRRSVAVDRSIVAAHVLPAFYRRRRKRRVVPPGPNAPTPEEIAQWRAVVEAFVPLLIEKWAPIVGVVPGKLAYRNMVSRWGSCNVKTGRICINVQLAAQPPECLEYVVVHELCHLREANHGPRFKALLDEFLPNWRAAQAKLVGAVRR